MQVTTLSFENMHNHGELFANMTSEPDSPLRFSDFVLRQEPSEEAV